MATTGPKRNVFIYIQMKDKWKDVKKYLRFLYTKIVALSPFWPLQVLSIMQCINVETDCPLYIVNLFTINACV